MEPTLNRLASRGKEVHLQKDNHKNKKHTVTLHIFNPEHDIALAYNRNHLTVPHAAQELRTNLGFLPALLAQDGDCILVDDMAYAIKAARPFRKMMAEVLFVEKESLRSLHFDNILPWGWDRKVRTELLESGLAESSMPTQEQLDTIRTLSARQTAANVLRLVRQGAEDNTCGESHTCTSYHEVEELIGRLGETVVKAPWSSSGRGVKYADRDIDEPRRQWIKKTIAQQGAIMVEPRYNKVRDFAMEFIARRDGTVSMCGLSVFHTANAQYTGNLVATEEYKAHMLERLLPHSIISSAASRLETILTNTIGGKYTGRLGVDMMIVASSEGRLLLHPCVEINLRNTMGHLALALHKASPDDILTMSIAHDVNYRLRLTPTDCHFANQM